MGSSPDIPDAEAACHQFRMLTYGELRERMLFGETITEETVATTIERAVTLFLDGYAVDKTRHQQENAVNRRTQRVDETISKRPSTPMKDEGAPAPHYTRDCVD